MALAVFADFASAVPGEPVGVLIGADAADLWKHVKADARFTTVELRLSAMAVDLAQVAAIVTSPEGKGATVSFALRDGRGVTLTFDADAARNLLADIPKPITG